MVFGMLLQRREAGDGEEGPRHVRQAVKDEGGGGRQQGEAQAPDHTHRPACGDPAADSGHQDNAQDPEHGLHPDDRDGVRRPSEA